jgi:zinc protease
MSTRTLFTAAVLVAATFSAQAQKQPAPPPGAPRDFTIPAVQRMTLPNGLEVRLVPYGDVPKAAVRLVTLTGNADEAASEVWLSDVTGAMMEQGTASRTSEAMAREIALMGGALDISVGMNATTIGMDVFSESVDEAVSLIADVARNPRFDEADLARVKSDLLRRASIQRTRPGSIAAEKFSQVLYGEHPYGRTFPTDAMLQGYSLAQVRSFHERNFGATRSAIYIVGRFDAPAVEKAIRQSLGDWKSGSESDVAKVAPVSRRAIYLIDRPGSVQSTLMIGLPVIDASNPEYLALTVMNSLLGGSFGSRITANIRERRGYTYSPSSTVTSRVGTAAWAETADVTTNVTGASIGEILSEIDRLRREPPTVAELKSIQNLAAGTFVLRNSSRGGIAAQLAFLDQYGLGEDYLRNYVQRVHALTPSDIQRLAQTYIDPAKLAIVVVGDKAQVLEQLKQYGEVSE